MIVEKMRMEDIPQVTTLQQQLMPEPVCYDRAEENYRAILADENYFVAVAREGDTVLGTLTGICCRGLGLNFLVLEDLIVREDLRGGGIGTALMQAVDDFGRERDCDYAILVSSGFRKRAHHFYEKMGYVEDVRGFRKSLAEV